MKLPTCKICDTIPKILGPKSHMFHEELTVTLNSPEMQDSLSPRSIKRYLGLSGNQGRTVSWIRAGTMLLAKRNGQLSSPPRSSLEKNKQTQFTQYFYNLTNAEGRKDERKEGRKDWISGLLALHYLSPTTCPSTSPRAVNDAEVKATAPLRFLGALSARYMGWMFMLTPAQGRQMLTSACGRGDKNKCSQPPLEVASCTLLLQTMW